MSANEKNFRLFPKSQINFTLLIMVTVLFMNYSRPWYLTGIAFKVALSANKNSAQKINAYELLYYFVFLLIAANDQFMNSLKCIFNHLDFTEYYEYNFLSINFLIMAN